MAEHDEEVLPSAATVAKDELLSRLSQDIEAQNIDVQAESFPESVQTAFRVYFEQTHDLDAQPTTNFVVTDDPFQGAITDYKIWQQSLQRVLLLLGGQHRNVVPLFYTVDSYFVQKQHRLSALSFLCAFITNQKGHNAHLVVNTPLYKHLLQCLLYDTSTAVISIALTTLVMLIPFTCNVIAKELLDLLSIYVRLLCWDQYKGTLRMIEPKGDAAKDDAPKRPIWDKLDGSADLPTSSPPDCAQYFSYLYGLFPNNMIKFLRDPHKYLEKSSSVVLSEEVDEEVVRNRSKPFIRRHKLNPIIVEDIAEGELKDNSRWTRLEAADVVANCLALDTLSSGALPTYIPDKPDPDKFNHVVIEEQSKELAADTEPKDSSVYALRRENLLLKNELNYEHYLKQQYLYHIGQLHRKHVEDIGVETERQLLYETIRTLKKQLADAQKQLERQRNEGTKQRSISKHFENKQRENVEKLREEVKVYKQQIVALKSEEQDANALAENLRTQVEDSRSQLFEAHNELSTLRPDVDKGAMYKQRVEQLGKELLLWQSDTDKFNERKEKLLRATAISRQMQMLLESNEAKLVEADSTIRNQEQEIYQLKLQLEVKTSKAEERRRILAEASQASGSDSRLEIEYKKLRQKHIALEKELLEVRASKPRDLNSPRSAVHI